VCLAGAYARRGEWLARLEGEGERQQCGLVLAPDRRVAIVAQQILGIKRGVEAVEADVCLWVARPYPLGDVCAGAHGGVHGHRDRTSRAASIASSERPETAVSTTLGVYPAACNIARGEARLSGWCPSS